MGSHCGGPDSKGMGREIHGQEASSMYGPMRNTSKLMSRQARMVLVNKEGAQARRPEVEITPGVFYWTRALVLQC